MVKRSHRNYVRLIIVLLIGSALGLFSGAASALQSGRSTQAGGADATSPSTSQEVIAELTRINEGLGAQNRAWRADVARLKAELAAERRARQELQRFINDHDILGPAFEQYAIFKEKMNRAENARKAAEVKARREERKRRLQQLREQRQTGRPTDQSADEDPSKTRLEQARRAGFVRIGAIVLVSEMGTVYKTETEQEVRYSPFLGTYYIDDDEIIDFSKLTLSGSVIHVADGPTNIGIAIAFYNRDGGQIGETTVQIEAARPGVPYPFTSKIDMASDSPFYKYSAWVLYAEPVLPVLPGNAQGP